MFVKSNSVADLKKYFFKKLESKFSSSEVRLMFQISIGKRLNLKSSELFFIDDLRLTESDLLFIREITNRLLSEEPFQYIIGETQFGDLDIICDKRALIPRPETEELVYWIDDTFRNKKESLCIIDFCTGSGCIALSLKNIFSNSYILATDYSKDALNLAKENSIKNQLEISFLEHDLLSENLTNIADGSQDCIVSNPPYIPENEKNAMHENVLKFEPHLALFVSNEDPLIFYKKITELAKIKLKKGGQLFFEIHEDLSEGVCNILLDFGFLDVEIKKDLQGKNRMIRAIN